MTKEHLSEIVEELKNDLIKELEKVDFEAYHPCSKRFVAAMNIGLMWKVLSHFTDHSDNISEEIEGAKKYAHSYELTKDISYKQMAKDELRHAGILMQKARAGMPGGANSETLKHHEEEIKKIAAGLDMAAMDKGAEHDRDSGHK